MMMLNQTRTQLSAQECHLVLQKQQDLNWDEACFHPVQAPTLMPVPPPRKILMHPQMWRNLLGRHHQRPKLQWVPPLGVVGFNVLSACEEAMSSRIVLTIES